VLVLTPDDERAVAATEALRSGLDDARRAEARAVLDRLAKHFGYCDACATAACAGLAAGRFA